MRRTFAIRRAEARNGHNSAGHRTQRARPTVLVARLAGEIPNFKNGGSLPQIINVPVEFSGRREVMLQPAPQPAAAKGAADIGIISGGEIEHAEPADGQAGGLIQAQDEAVGAFMGRKCCVHTNTLMLRCRGPCLRPIACPLYAVQRAFLTSASLG